jgi:hypothetical protein
MYSGNHWKLASVLRTFVWVEDTRCSITMVDAILLTNYSFKMNPHSVPEIHFNATEGAIKLAFRCCWYICTILLFLLIFNKWKLSIAYLGTLVWQYYTFSYTVIKKLPAYFLTEKYKVFMQYMRHAHTFPCVSAGCTLFIVNFKHWNAFGYFPIAWLQIRCNYTVLMIVLLRQSGSLSIHCSVLKNAGKIKIN